MIYFTVFNYTLIFKKKVYLTQKWDNSQQQYKPGSIKDILTVEQVSNIWPRSPRYPREPSRTPLENRSTNKAWCLLLIPALLKGRQEAILASLDYFEPCLRERKIKKEKMEGWKGREREGKGREGGEENITAVIKNQGSFESCHLETQLYALPIYVCMCVYMYI